MMNSTLRSIAASFGVTECTSDTLVPLPEPITIPSTAIPLPVSPRAPPVERTATAQVDKEVAEEADDEGTTNNVQKLRQEIADTRRRNRLLQVQVKSMEASQKKSYASVLRRISCSELKLRAVHSGLARQFDHVMTQCQVVTARQVAIPPPNELRKPRPPRRHLSVRANSATFIKSEASGFSKPPASKKPKRLVNPSYHENNGNHEPRRPLWDVHNSSPMAAISNNGCDVITMRRGWTVAMAKHASQCFSVRVTHPSSKSNVTVAIGLTRNRLLGQQAPSPARTSSPPLDFAFHMSGWFLDFHSGRVSSLDGDDNSPYCTGFTSKAVVTVQIKHGALSYFKNGRHLGIAKSGLPNIPLYPVMVSYNRGVRVEFVDAWYEVAL
ncbi:hypothetical protein DYB34_000638 [Aphanomyces astaci]|uniref:B30.2/SPRY domain-containing protein n=2 Tax=Aphanomyces astaci TaxID=112090 RepID=A0A3R6ZYK5_APHAT|nr:hypothetical protein DYB34_000638 [Aphanomyces astaci]